MRIYICVIATCNEYIGVLRSTGAIPIWGNDKNTEGLRTLVSLGELLLGFTGLYRASEKDELLGIVLYEGGGNKGKGRNGTRGYRRHNQLF